MRNKIIRHQRIVTLRAMALKGATYLELEEMCKKMGVSNNTRLSYIQEVVEDLRKIKKKF
jgi:hypothetical protein